MNFFTTPVKDGHIVVSLDVHSQNTYIVAVDSMSGEILADYNIIERGYKSLLKKIPKLGSKKRLFIMYEAGPCGFALYRILIKQGYRCGVIAPTSIPKRKGKKTDREDCFNNLSLFLAGKLRFVHVPSEAEQLGQELVRYRQDKLWQRTKTKQKLYGMLSRHNIIYTLTKCWWTKTFYLWINNISLTLELRIIVDMYLQQIQQFDKAIIEIEQTIDRYIQSNPYFSHMQKYYRLLPGIGSISAANLIFEGRDFTRFKRAPQLMNFSGLVPEKYSSGKSDPDKAITKQGNKMLRLTLVAIARCYTNNKYLMGPRKLKKVPDEIKTFIVNMQSRLYNRYKHLRAKGKVANKAKIAIARELCGFLWDYVNNYIPATQMNNNLALQH